MMLNVLDTVDKLAEELKAMQPLKIEYQEKLDKKFRLEFNYNSNHLEGNTLTYGETELLLIFDETKGNHALREYEEMKAHDVAYKLIDEWVKAADEPLTEQKIKNLNEIILVRPYWKDAITADGQNTRRQIRVGDYKEFPNSVRLPNGEIFHYTSPIDTPIEMQELIDWYKSEEGHIHTVTLAAMFHYKFVRIHPFDDGNGRISRLLVNYVLLKNGLPPLIIKSNDKKNYLSALHQADIGDYEPFINYIGEQLIWSLKVYIKAGKGENIEETDDIKKEIALLSKELSTRSTSKSPVAIYETFKWFDKNVWQPLTTALNEFASLFAEKDELHFVNLMPEKFEKREILLTSALFTTKEIPKIKIWGKDIYDTEIDSLKWEFTYYGLRGAKRNPKLETTLKLEFRVDKYWVTINNIGFSQSFDYGTYMTTGDIEQIVNNMSKAILEQIKTNTI